MGSVPEEKKSDVVKKVKTVKVEEVVVTPVKSAEVLEQELSEAISSMDSELPEFEDAIMNQIQKEIDLSNTLKNIKMIDLKIEVWEREVSLTNWSHDREAHSHAVGEVERLRSMRRDIIKSAPLL